MHTARERLNIKRLRILPVNPVPDPAQPREVTQVLRRECAHPRGVTHERTPSCLTRMVWHGGGLL
jgi:hypothetical protein